MPRSCRHLLPMFLSAINPATQNIKNVFIVVKMEIKFPQNRSFFEPQKCCEDVQTKKHTTSVEKEY